MLGSLLPLSALAGTTCPADRIDEYARIRYVHDGDTVHLDDGRKIRLIGINTPELARDSMPGQAYAQNAREILAKTVADHENRVALVYGKERYDRHKRTLAHLFSPDGENLQAQLLQRGLAAAIAHPPNLAFTDCYTEQEKVARCAGRGIWTDPEHAVLQAPALTAANQGFHRVSGYIEQVSESSRGVWLFMSELMISVRRDDLDHFDLVALRSLKGQQVIVRGWLHPSNSKQKRTQSGKYRPVRFFMRIRHPSAIETNHSGCQ